MYTLQNQPNEVPQTKTQISFPFREKSLILVGGNSEKNGKSLGKVRAFEKLPEKLIVNRILKNMISMNCKQFMVRKTT